VRQHLEQLYRDHRQGLFTLALSIAKCPARAEDAVQEAFARLWGSDGRPSDPVPYVYAAVRHAAIDQTRRAAAAARAETASIFNGVHPDPANDAIAAERVRRLREAVDALPDDERQAVVLRIYAGLTFEQAAETLGEPLPTVASRYRRALERLETAVQRMEGGIP
jgi:RNA polymerase sigma-70 factor (ECF subfamily)